MIKDLKTEYWVAALIKRAQIGGANGFVARKGDVDAGSVLIRIWTDRENSKILSPSRDAEGRLIFVDLTSNILKNQKEETPQQSIQNYIDKRIIQDNDIWVVDLEDKLGRDFLIEKVE